METLYIYKDGELVHCIPTENLPLMQQINIMTEVMQLTRLGVRECVFYRGRLLSPTLPSSFMKF